MSFVPYVPTPTPSLRAYELARRLKETIDAYRRENPDLSATEIRQAIHLARTSTGGSQRLVAILVLGLVVLLAAWLFARGGPPPGGGQPMILLIVVAGIVAVALIALVARKR